MIVKVCRRKFLGMPVPEQGVMLWPADPKADDRERFWSADEIELYEIAEADLRFLLRWKTARSLVIIDDRRRSASFDWADLAPLLEEFDG